MKTYKMKSQKTQSSYNKWRETRLPKKIFIVMLVLSLGSTILLFGCERPGGAAADKRVADLEKQVQVLQEQNRDLRAKARAAHIFGNTSLQDFFASPEFWQCTYDSSWADCSSRCSKQTRDGYNACLQNHPEGPERQACVTENAESGAACLKNCPVQMSPLSPPDCAGGTGPHL